MKGFVGRQDLLGVDVCIESAGANTLRPENEIKCGLIGRPRRYDKWQLVTEGTVGRIRRSLLAVVAQYHACFETVGDVHHLGRAAGRYHLLRVVRADHKREGEGALREYLAQLFLAINTC